MRTLQTTLLKVGPDSTEPISLQTGVTGVVTPR